MITNTLLGEPPRIKVCRVPGSLRERLDLSYLGFLQKATKPCLINGGIELF